MLSSRLLVVANTFLHISDITDTLHNFKSHRELNSVERLEKDKFPSVEGIGKHEHHLFFTTGFVNKRIKWRELSPSSSRKLHSKVIVQMAVQRL